MENEIEKIKERVTGVEGYFGDTEGAFLYRAARKLSGTGDILEIGSWKGKSTIWLAHAAKANGHGANVFAIDPHTGSPEHQAQFGKVDTFTDFKNNIQNSGVVDVVVPLRMTSEAAAHEWGGKKIEFLWIDGAHEFNMVKKDFDYWNPYLVEGGIIAFHDTGIRTKTEGPKQFVEKYIFRSRTFRNVQFFETITMAEKVKQNTLLERLQNLFTLLYKRTYQRTRRMSSLMKQKIRSVTGR